MTFHNAQFYAGNDRLFLLVAPIKMDNLRLYWRTAFCQICMNIEEIELL